MAVDIFIYGAIGLVFFVLIAFWIYIETQFKHRVRIKELTKGRKIIKNYKARDYIDSSRVSWWKLSSEKDKYKRLIPLPPEESIEIDAKGKKYVEAYRFEGGEVVYIKDDWDVKECPFDLDSPPQDVMSLIESAKDPSEKKKIFDTWRKNIVADWKLKSKSISPFQPITTKQRLIYLNNIKKAESRRATGWKEQLVPLASIGALVLIVIALMVFWGDIAAPALEAGKQAKLMAEINKENLQLLKEIRSGQQTIGDKLGVPIVPPVTPVPQNG